MKNNELVITRWHCGPPRSGNGGYTSGLLGQAVGGTATVRLMIPPPLDTPLAITEEDAGLVLMAGETVVARGRADTLTLEVPEAPSWDEAADASKGFPGFVRHSFPTCLVCGTARSPGDGLRIFPGPLSGRQVLATTWVPDQVLCSSGGQVDVPYVWAALDCPGAFAVMPEESDVALVLGQFTVRIERRPLCGVRCVVVAWPLGNEGRKFFAGSAIYAEGGELLAFAKAVWISVPASAWG